MRLSALSLFVLPSIAFAQVRDSTVAATANRNVRVPADRASLYVIVEGSAETPVDASARVETKVRAVSEALKGVASHPDVDRPMSYSTSPAMRDQNYPGMTSTPQYVARTIIHVQTTHPDQLGAIVSTALGAGASSVSSLTFEASTIDSVKRARLGDAIASAKADAEAMASALGGHLGALLEVTSTGGFQFANGASTQLSFDTRFGFPQSPTPEVNLTVNVTVRYRLVR